MNIHHGKCLCSLAVIFALACLAPAAATSQAKPGKSVQATTDAPPLRTREALDAYLQAHKGKPTPLDALPPLARQRFLESLAFGRSGLGGFSTAELATELTPDEIVAVLTLFDVQDYARAVQSRYPDGTPNRHAQAAQPGQIERDFDALYRLQLGGDTTALQAFYEADFAPSLRDPDVIGRLPERELIYLLRATDMVSNDVPNASNATRLQQVAAAMQARGIARPQDVRKAYDALLQTRQFDAAKRYAVQNPDADLPAMPNFVDPTGNDAPVFTAWRSDADTDTLTREALDLRPTQILVTAGCHFSQDAAEDIGADPVLGPAFAAHAHWLMLQPGKEDPSAIRDWNRRFPQAQALQVYDRDEWTQLPPRWNMPEFFIVRDGKVIDSMKSWPRDADAAAHRQKLIEMLQRAGLLDTGKPQPASTNQGSASIKR